jgi:hypothetical protein
MTYRCGTLGLGHIGIGDSEPTIRCDGDGCDARIVIRPPPPTWFLDGKTKRFWSKVGDGSERKDYCPLCKVKRKARTR